MTRIFFARRSLGIAALAAGLIAVTGWTIHLARAADPAPAKPADGKAADGKAADAKAEGANAFAVPEGTPAELLEFIDKVRQAQPPADAKSQEDIKTFVKKSRTAMLQAADKILDSKPNAKTRVEAIHAKIEALAQLDEVSNDAKVTKQLHDYVDELQNDKVPEVAKMGRQVSLMLRIRALDTEAGAADAPKIWADIKAGLKAAPEDPENIQLAVMAAQAFEELPGKNTDLAAQAYRELVSVLSKSKDPRLNAYAKQFEGVARRLSLMGNPIEFKGTVLNGKAFDPGTLKGKVVLVDFWATWCDPCRQELPNVLANYKKYHDKGFEVVGVSLDKDKGALEKFIADQKLPWPILFNDNTEEEFWNAPMAVYYGISGIPTVILTNQKGEVVSLNARGPELGKKLAELLDK